MNNIKNKSDLWPSHNIPCATWRLCLCGCNQKIKVHDNRGRKRYWIKGHHSFRPMKDCFWEKVKKTNTCWLWTGALLRSGYGQLGSTRTGIFHQAHRFSWIIHRGPIPKGMQCLHHCDNPPCVNPEHLFLGTNVDNVRDKVSKSRQARGNDIPHAALSPEKVRKMRKLYATEKFTYCRIGKMFGVFHTTAGNAISGRQWRHVR